MKTYIFNIYMPSGYGAILDEDHPYYGHEEEFAKLEINKARGAHER